VFEVFVSQPSFAVAALQSPKPPLQVGVHVAETQVAAGALVKLQVLPQVPQ
jgi:hypothetical protein